MSEETEVQETVMKMSPAEVVYKEESDFVDQQIGI